MGSPKVRGVRAFGQEVNECRIVGIILAPDIEDAAQRSIAALLDREREAGGRFGIVGLDLDGPFDAIFRHHRASFHLAKASRIASAGLVTASDAVPPLRHASTPLSNASIAASSSSSGVGGSGSVTALFG